jgi:putative endonuclease
MNNGKYYTGLTDNLQRRLNEHKTGKSISTRNNLPVKLIYYVQMNSRKEARWLEKKIKNRGAKKYLHIRTYSKTLREIEVIIDQREKELNALNSISPHIE